MLNPEHGRSDAQVEFHNARNIRVYALKAEGICTLLWMRGCHDIGICGYGGVAAPRPDWPLFKIDDSDDFLIANADPDDFPNEPALKYWDAAGVASDPQKWLLIADRPRQSEPPVQRARR